MQHQKCLVLRWSFMAMNDRHQPPILCTRAEAARLPMHPVSQLQWSIPGVGPLQPSFDRVEIVSSATVGKLKELLPIAALELACHRFELRTYTGPDPRLRSRMVIVGSHAANPWPILAKHEADLARYRTTRAEIAFDVEAASIAAARDGLFALIGQLGKRRHQRGHIFSVHKPDD